MERGITSPALWRALDPAEYRRYKKRNKKGLTVKEILRDVVTHLPWCRTFKVFLLRGVTPTYIETNSVFRLLEANDYCPRSVGTAILRWAEMESPRNTLWISGSPRSGAEALIECLFYLAPLRSVADARRQNPFARCTPSVLIWWNSGRIQEQHVGLVRQVLGGQHVVFPELLWEEGLSRELYRTPVLVSSDAMHLVVDGSGAELDGYAPMLESTMYHLHLTEDLPPDENLTETDVMDFFCWVDSRPATINDNVYDLHQC